MSATYSIAPAPGPRLRLMVIDYDDTLCPSSWIAAAPERQATENDLAILQHVEESIAGLLRQADALGCSVVIITNADEEWVKFSSRRFLPRVVPLLARVRVVSARHYEALYPGRSVCWKAAAFTHVAKAFFAAAEDELAAAEACAAAAAGRPAPPPRPPPPREIISIGDSNDERLAVRAAARPLDATPKAIKLVDAPSLHTIACQLHTVATCLPFVAHGDFPIDVDVAAILAYVGAAHRDGPVHDVLQRVWRDAAWGVLTAIRFQGNEANATLDDAPPPPDGSPSSPAPNVVAAA